MLQVLLGAAYHAYTLSNAECATQAWTDSDHVGFATLTLKGCLSNPSK